MISIEGFYTEAPRALAATLVSSLGAVGATILIWEA
jgi:hypothetical protein